MTSDTVNIDARSLEMQETSGNYVEGELDRHAIDQPRSHLAKKYSDSGGGTSFFAFL